MVGFSFKKEGIKRYLLLAIIACLVKKCNEDIMAQITKLEFDVDKFMKVLRGPSDGPMQWEVGLLYFLMALLFLPEFVNIEWLHEKLPNYILGFTLCLLFVLFDESVALWHLMSEGQWKKQTTMAHHENLLLSLANLSLFYANLKMHAFRKAIAEVREARKNE